MNEAAAVKTIIFEDHQQDFLEWDIDAGGMVVACRPFQGAVWCGRRVVNPDVEPGEQVFVTVDELAYMEIDHTMPVKYPVAAVISAERQE